jgi:hypothetical protein
MNQGEPLLKGRGEPFSKGGGVCSRLIR